MTKNEFILCCELLYKHHRGKKLKEILKSSGKFVDIKIENIVYDILEDKIKFRNNESSESIMYFMREQLRLNGKIGVNEFNYDKVEDFLNYFKIPMEDIV